MTVDDFLMTMERETPPEELSQPVQALWWDRKGDWDKAHACAQDARGSDGSWVHAYLHRVEGDLGNTGYWYRRAGRPAHAGVLREEWREIASRLLAQN